MTTNKVLTLFGKLYLWVNWACYLGKILQKKQSFANFFAPNKTWLGTKIIKRRWANSEKTYVQTEISTSKQWEPNL